MGHPEHLACARYKLREGSGCDLGKITLLEEPILRITPVDNHASTHGCPDANTAYCRNSRTYAVARAICIAANGMASLTKRANGIATPFLCMMVTATNVEAEPIGPRAVAVHAFPSLLFERGVEPAPFLLELLANPPQLAGEADSEAALHEVLDMMSCKAAIKSGDRLTQQELAELLAWREKVDRSSRCPHGRPTTLRLTLADLDKQFGRR